MIYVICYDWASTSGNHTGMRYLYEYIQKSNPELYKMYTCLLYTSDAADEL